MIYITALLVMLSAVATALTGKVFRAIFFLTLSLVLTSLIYFQAGWTLLGAVQIILYAGATAVLFAFALFTVGRRFAFESPKRRFVALIPSAVTFAVVYLFSPSPKPQKNVLTEEVGKILFERWFLPFEILSFLLLASLVGAIWLLKK